MHGDVPRKTGEVPFGQCLKCRFGMDAEEAAAAMAKSPQGNGRKRGIWSQDGSALRQPGEVLAAKRRGMATSRAAMDGRKRGVFNEGRIAAVSVFCSLLILLYAFALVCF